MIGLGLQLHVARSHRRYGACQGHEVDRALVSGQQAQQETVTGGQSMKT